MSQLRGTITRVSFHVEYPDGSCKDSTFEPETELKAIMFSEDYMTDDMKALFTRSRVDWKVNPAMIIVDGKIMKPNCDWPDCQIA